MFQFRVRDRTTATVAGVIGLVAMVIFAIILQTNAARQHSLRVNQVRAPAALASQRLYLAALGSANALRGYIVTRDPTMREEWAEQWREIDRQSAALDAMKGRFTEPKVRESWRKARQVLPRFKAAQARAMELAATAPPDVGPPDVAARALRSDVLPLFAEVRDLMTAGGREPGMIPTQTGLLVADLSATSASAGRANTALLVGGALMLLLLAALAARTLNAPLGEPVIARRARAPDDRDEEIPPRARAFTVARLAPAPARPNGRERDRLSREAELVRAELNCIYESAPVGLALLDRNLRYVRVNAALAEMNGAPAEAHIGRTVVEVAPGVAPKLAEQLVKVAASGTALFDLEVTGTTPSQPGLARTWLQNIAPVRHPDGEGYSILVSMLEITPRKRAEARAKLLIDELNHSVKNTLAVVQSVAAQTLRAKTNLDDFRQAFEGRLVALSEAHNLLSSEHWEGAWLRILLETQLKPFAVEQQVLMLGEPVRLNAHAALALGLVAHELAANAVSHGALSTPAGRVRLEWAICEGELRLAWDESGGPPVRNPEHRGFGARLIERTVVKDFGGKATLKYEPEGLSCIINLPLRAIAADPGGGDRETRQG